MVFYWLASLNQSKKPPKQLEQLPVGGATALFHILSELFFFIFHAVVFNVYSV